jgi:signal transduction histidine kinase
MKIKLLLFSILFVGNLYSYGQEDKIKLLIHDFKLAKADTHKIKLINELVRVLDSNKRLKEEKIFLDKGLILCDKVEDKYWLANMLLNYGIYYESLSQDDKAKVYYDKAIALLKNRKDMNSVSCMGTCWAQMGAIYNRKGELETGMKYLLKGADVWDKSNLKEKYTALGNIYGSMATDFYHVNQMEKALQYDLKGVKIREKNKVMTAEDAKAYIYLSSDFSALKKFDSASLYLSKGKMLADKLKVPALSVEYNRIFAKLYIDQKKYKEALPYGLESLRIGKEMENDNFLSNSHNILSLIYINLKQGSKALIHSKIELEMARNEKKNRSIMIALFNVSRSENMVGQYKSAYEHLLEYKVLKDSVFASTEKLKMNEIEEKYNGAKKQNEILEKTIALEKSSNNMKLLGGGFGLFSLLAGLGFYSYRKRERAKSLESELETQRLERQRIASEMHDELGGNLTSLMYLAHNLKDKATKNAQVDKIIQTSGNISESINEIVWALNQEQNQLSDWVFYVRGKTAELFENAGVNYKFNILEPVPDRTLSNIEKRNLYLVVKEAINNALKHSKASHYEVNMDFESSISIEIKDNGIGFIENGSPKTGGGNGLKNMSRRIEEIGGTIAWSNGEGTSVKIKI